MSSNCKSNWCPEVFRGLNVERFNDDQLLISPCCIANTAKEAVSTFSFTQSPHLNKIRQDMIDGNRPTACSRCWQDEDIGQKSRRHGAIEFFNLSGPDTTVELQALDHNITWACNLNCIMCGPHFSSQWAQELNLSTVALEKIGKKYQKRNKFLDRVDVSNLKKLHFNGGEPMLNHDHIDFLKKIETLDQIQLSYNTNATIYPSDELIELWQQIKLVKLFFSIDAVGGAFEYIRYPGNWKQVHNNIVCMREKLPSNVMFGLNITVGSYNIFELPELHQWFEQTISTNREGDISDFCWQIAYNYNPSQLPMEIKQQAIEKIKNIPQYIGLANSLIANGPANDIWIKKLNDIDSRRGTSWRNSLTIGKIFC